MRFRTSTLTLFAGAIALAILGGCVASESSRYEQKLSARVTAKPASDGHVATAFGLNEPADAPTAVVSVPTDR